MRAASHPAFFLLLFSTWINMSRFQVIFLALIVLIAMLWPSLTLSAEEDHSGLNSELDIVYREQVIPLLRAYCWDCHSEDEDVVLNQDEAVEDLRGNRDVWIRAIAQLRSRDVDPLFQRDSPRTCQSSVHPRPERVNS